MTFSLTWSPEEWSLLSMNRVFWNCEPNINFSFSKIVLISLLVTAVEKLVKTSTNIKLFVLQHMEPTVSGAILIPWHVLDLEQISFSTAGQGGASLFPWSLEPIKGLCQLGAGAPQPHPSTWV